MNDGKRTPSYWAVVPAPVRYDASLRPNAKLLYAEITALANESGYCYCKNAYFARLFSLATKTVSDLISTLAERGYINVQLLRDPQTQEVVERRIFCGFDGARAPTPNFGDTSPHLGDPPPKNVDTPPPKITEENNTSSFLNNTPIVPKGTDRQLTQLFEQFWAAYPKKKAKPSAYRAFVRKKVDRPLLAQMLAALEVQRRLPDWGKDGGTYVPHPATWLNNERWLDDVGGGEEGGGSGRFADDPEVF